MLFDPTVFDNLKVAIENQVYDLDNLDGLIRITNRTDRLDMAVMSRYFAIRFTLADASEVSADMVLTASLADLAAELLDKEGAAPACELRIVFDMPIVNVHEQCKQVEQVIQTVWQPEHPLEQTLSFSYGQENILYRNAAELRFNRKINEDQMNDIPDLLDHVLRTLEQLTPVIESSIK
ncbi:hypothetical protein [Paenibacillus sp. NPDC058071]|uniref:hypothetical protein n=1 Tax=Paenibacillus sp. NPDC058071 TaxID=3346326 RepID=UPI0036D82C85